MLETLGNLSSRLRMPPLIPAEVDKIRECISDNKSATMELEKLQPSFEALKRRGEELIGRSQGADKDLAAKGAWWIELFLKKIDTINSRLWLPPVSHQMNFIECEGSPQVISIPESHLEVI